MNMMISYQELVRTFLSKKLIYSSHYNDNYHVPSVPQCNDYLNE